MKKVYLQPATATETMLPETELMEVSVDIDTDDVKQIISDEDTEYTEAEKDAFVILSRYFGE